MTLEFSKNKDGNFVAQATVNGDYALHVERSKIGSFRIKQKSVSDGEYANCNIPKDIEHGQWVVLDQFFSHGYYPMNVEFISSSEVTKAELNEVTV